MQDVQTDKGHQMSRLSSLGQLLDPEILFQKFEPLLYKLTDILSQKHAVAGVQFAPVFVSPERRLQTLAVMHYISAFILSPLAILYLTIYLYANGHYYILLAYFLWFLIDRKTPAKGSRPVSFFRSKFLWKPFADYFPMKLEKTVELDPERNYIIGSHPHGIFACSSFLNFGTDAGGFSELFPGITNQLVTLVGQFWYPLRREYGMLMGAIESSREGIEYVLRQEKGRAVTIVVGGGSEVAFASPGSYDVILNNRKGFIKMALRMGADLVPAYNFGENDLFVQYKADENSWQRRCQVWLKRYCGFCVPIFHGRGVFNYTYGLLPFRNPVTSVVGSPVKVTQTPNPSQKEIDDLHAQYVQALVELFENQKSRFGISDETHLVIH